MESRAVVAPPVLINHSIDIYLLDFLPEACVSFVKEEIKSACIAFPTIKELLHP